MTSPVPFLVRYDDGFALFQSVFISKSLTDFLSLSVTFPTESSKFTESSSITPSKSILTDDEYGGDSYSRNCSATRVVVLATSAWLCSKAIFLYFPEHVSSY